MIEKQPTMVEYADGNREWWLDGKLLTKAAHREATAPPTTKGSE